MNFDISCSVLHVFFSLFLTALDIEPDDPYVLKRLADVEGKLGMSEKAVKDYRRAIEIQSKRPIYASEIKTQEESATASATSSKDAIDVS